MSTSEDEDPGRRRARQVRVALQTVGCKLNRAETESLARKFLAAGFKVVPPPRHGIPMKSGDSNPDVYLLNTCTVTHVADHKCRQYLRSFHLQNPNAFILVTGCYAERAAAELSRIKGVNLVVGNANKDRIVEIVREQIGERNSSTKGEYLESTLLLRTRPLVKIQDGCNQHCTYCIVPQVRGKEHSTAVETIVSEVKDRVEEGYKEVILTGTQIGSYDRDGGIEGLIRRILNETSIPRLRLSSLQPQDLPAPLIQLWKSNERICRHLHLPLQSGSDSVLRRMRRKYSSEEYEHTVALVQDAIPGIAITTDIIVGFPGESEEEFEQSYEFCAKIGFAGLHVFPYSLRPGTPASRMSNQVPERVKKARNRKMLELAKEIARGFRKQFLGESLRVLWEEKKGDNLWVGHTDNYLKVFTKNKASLSNCLIRTKLVSECEQGLWGITKFQI